MNLEIRGMTEDTSSPEEEEVLAALFALKPDDEGEGVVSPLDELSLRRAIEAVLDRLDAKTGRPAKQSKIRTRLFIAAGVSVAAACVVVLLLKSPFENGGTQSQVASMQHRTGVSPVQVQPIVKSNSSALDDEVTNRLLIPGSRFALLFGDVSVGDKDVTMGAGIPTSERIRTGNGKIALSLPTGIAVGLSENSSARVLWNGKEQYGVTLLNGTALFSVDPALKRDGFFVETPAGTVRVNGTLFSVMVSPDNGVLVKLHHGKVIVERPDGGTESLEGENLISIGHRIKDLTLPTRDIERQLMAIESIDDGSLFTELKKLSGSEEKKRNIDRSFKHSANDLSIQDLMNLARGRKSSGNWTGAVSSYNELIRLYADSDEARTSTLSIGQIYLHHLNKPKAALAAFNDYLKQPGPLTQEALYGRAQAFRSLQDLKNEIESLHSFLNSFPDGVYAPAVQNRLRELQ